MARQSVALCRRRGPFVLISSALVCCLAGASLAGTASDEIRAWLEKEQQSSGATPGPSVLAAKIREFSGQLSPREQTGIWSQWARMQKPTFDKQDIARTIDAKRAAIETARFQYSILDEKPGSSEPAYDETSDSYVQPAYTRRSFLMDGDKLRTERQEGASPEQLGPPYLQAYDGNYVRTLETEPEGLGLRATVGHFQARYPFFDFTHPLAGQMLLDSARDMGMSFPSYDLAYFLRHAGAYILDAAETVDGRKAVLCALSVPPISVVWLDPERNFAVLQLQSYDVARDDKSYLVTDVQPSSISKAVDFQEFAGGLWLPRQTEITEFSEDGSGRIARHIVVETKEARLNEVVPASEFTDIFPAGVEVIDGVIGDRYTVAEPDAADKTLSDVVKDLKSDKADTAVAPEVDATGIPQTASAQAQPPASAATRAWFLAAALVAVGVVIFLVLRMRKASRRE